MQQRYNFQSTLQAGTPASLLSCARRTWLEYVVVVHCTHDHMTAVEQYSWHLSEHDVRTPLPSPFAAPQNKACSDNPADEEYSDYAGALRCLTQGSGDIAFTKLAGIADNPGVWESPTVKMVGATYSQAA
jgi:hypothetical protein